MRRGKHRRRPSHSLVNQPEKTAERNYNPAVVPAARLSRIARSVNISRWFRYPAGPTPEHFLAFMTDEDLALLARLGIGGVRLTIGGEQLIRKHDDSALVEDTLACLKTAI